jgi:hypothetical protein
MRFLFSLAGAGGQPGQSPALVLEAGSWMYYHLL